MARFDPAEGRRLYGDDPEAYAAGRPDYPDRLYELLRTLGVAPGSRVLEIGPGSGMVTRRLCAAGAEVTAVEADSRMADHVRQTIGCEVVASPLETAPIPAGAFDVAVAATSFHWVAQPAGWERLVRAIRPGGRAVIWWMLFEDPTDPDDFDRATHGILAGSPSLPATPSATPFQIDTDRRQADFRQAGLVEVGSELIRSSHSMTAADIVALYATLAIVLRRPPDEREQVLTALDATVRERFGGRVERTFLTAVYWGTKSGAP